MQIVPLIPTPSQTLQVALGGQPCTLNVYEKSTGLYIDVYVNSVLIVGGVICENMNRIVRSVYLGFIGDLAFYDTAGTADPTYTGLGSRWQLAYLTEDDLTTFGLSG